MAFGHHPLPSPSLCGRVTLSVGVHSVYAPVGESGGLLASFGLSVDGVSSRPPMVAPSPSSLSRRVSAPSVSCPSLLVRRLGRGLGLPSRLSVASGLWDTRRAALSIYARDWLAVPLGLCQFRSPLRGRTVAVFCDKPQLCIPFARGVALGLLSSPPWLRRSCARWSPSPSACLHSSFRAPTPTPCLALTSSHIQSGLYT